MRTVRCILNGQLRPVSFARPHHRPAHPRAEKADNRTRANRRPFAVFVTLKVAEGDKVSAGARSLP